MTRRVAVVGLSHSNKWAPFGDPSWEVWCLRHDPRWFDARRVYELHDLDWIEENGGQPALNKLAEIVDLGIPLYMRLAYFDGVRQYPIESVIAAVGRDYFESSIAMMFAHALAEGVEHIGLWGVAMKANSEYAYQRPNMEWLIGLAQGRGVRVDIPETDPLLKFNGGKPRPRRDGREQLRYGQWQLPTTES